MTVSLSNLTISRVSAGSSGVVPPSGDPYWSSVSLLTETTSINGATNNTFLDSSTNAYAITATGSVAQGSVTPFTSSGGSIYLDGAAGNYLTTSAAVSTSMNPSDFTVEAWVYTELVDGVSHAVISNCGATNADNNYWVINLSAGNKFSFQLRDTVGQAIMSGTTTPTVNTWYHVAVTRKKSTNECKLYVNGVLEATATINKAITTRPTFIGTFLYTGFTQYWKGYISNAAVTTSLKYTGNFTPSTTPLTAVTGTQLLLSATNAGLYDAAKKNDMYTKVSAQVSTTQSKWSPTSLYLNGSSYVTVPASANLQFVGGDFTIEGWVYPTTAALQQMINQDDAVSNNQTCTVRKEANNALTFIYYTSSVRGSVVTATTSNTMPLNAWSYIAISRTGSTLKMYINGVQGYSASAATMFQGTNPTTLGGFTNGLYAYMFTGYMQDIRITKGVGRYPVTCTVPTAALPTS